MAVTVEIKRNWIISGWISAFAVMHAGSEFSALPAAERA